MDESLDMTTRTQIKNLLMHAVAWRIGNEIVKYLCRPSINHQGLGFTVHYTWMPPTTGYLVSVRGGCVFTSHAGTPESRVSVLLPPNRDPLTLTAKQVGDHLISLVGYHFFEWHDVGLDELFVRSYWGAWDDGEKLYLDRSLHHRQLDVALKEGKKQNQIAIWDCRLNKEIRV
jgi:hypothetical protein